MRALRIATFLIAVLSLLGGSTMAAMAATAETDGPIGPVVGSYTVQPMPGGTFEVDDRVFQYRDFQVGGSAHHLSDPRLRGDLLSEWNWDVLSAGDQPVPAWGTITIAGDDGTWSGDFSGIRPSYFEPVGIRAVLYGDGAYEGLCATLDITALQMARGDTWLLDGIVHPVDVFG